MTRRRLLLVAAIAAAFWTASVAGAQAATQPAWAALEIGPLFQRCNFDSDICDDDISSYDINAQGWVVGDAFPDVHWAWIWKSDGAMAVLGDGTGPYDEAGALAENSTGDTTGYMYSSSDFDIPTHAFRLKNGVWTDLPTLAGGFATGYGITDTDVLVGASTTASGARHAVRWPSTGQITDLDTLGGVNSQANAINSTGQIVGWAETASGHQHAFVFQSGHMSDLGTLGGQESVANSINASGQIVGWAATATGAHHAFLYSGGHMTDLGNLLPTTMSSEAFDITNAGDVVGTATRQNFQQFGFLYRSGAMTDLSQRTITCCDIIGGRLNKNLQIVPYGLAGGWFIPVLEPVSVFDDNSAKITYTGTWTRTSSTDAWGGGKIKSASAANASAKLTFTGRRVWWIAPKGVGGGQARVYIDGALKTTVDLSVSTTGSTQRQTAYQQSWPSSGTHTIKVVVVGTPGTPRVDVDGFAVSKL